MHNQELPPVRTLFLEALAWWLRSPTTVSWPWISEQLWMGG